MPDTRFVLRPVRDLDRDLVIEFSIGVLGSQDPAAVTKWWMTSDYAEAVAAIDVANGRIAGMVVAVPSHWPLPDGRSRSTVSICGWYVAPDYAGQGLGKLLVRSFDDRAPCQNALSISNAAIRNFTKLGWTGPFRTRLLLMPLPAYRRSPRLGVLTRRAYAVRGAGLPADLADALGQIESERPAGQIRRRRNADDWRAHLAVYPRRMQSFNLIERGGRPIAAFVIRGADDQAGKIYRRAGLHYVTDLVLNADDPEALSFIAASIAPAAPARAGALLLCTSDERLASAVERAGWWSESTPVIGPRLASKAPLYMLGGELSEVPQETVRMTFTDSDVDLNI